MPNCNTAFRILVSVLFFVGVQMWRWHENLRALLNLLRLCTGYFDKKQRLGFVWRLRWNQHFLRYLKIPS